MPDGCESDCNQNGIPDQCEQNWSDCNTNGLFDLCELQGNDCNANLIPDDCEPDADLDGVIDVCDNCLQAANPEQADSDGDGFGDACDNCRFFPNPAQENRDGDSAGDACDPCPDDPLKVDPGLCGCDVRDDANADADAHPDCIDNCPFIPNDDQEDCDFDFVGDVCERDCNFNSVPDDCESVTIECDCNSNGINDEIELPGNDCDGNSLLDQCQLCGDFDVDQDLDGQDFSTFLLAFGAHDGDINYLPCADYDADGAVTLVDYQSWLACYRAWTGSSVTGPPAPADLGDLNADGYVNGQDIQPFIETILWPSGAGFRDRIVADMNGSGAATSADAPHFVATLLNAAE